MKKRRTLIISLLLVAALALGVGYAAMTVDTSVTGSATLDPNSSNFHVHFKGTPSSNAAYGQATIDTLDPTKATFSIFNSQGLADIMDNVGDSVTFTYVIENKSEDGYNAKINGNEVILIESEGTLIVGAGSGDGNTHSYDEYFTITSALYATDANGDKAAAWVAADDILEPDEKAILEITVTLKKVLINDSITLNGFVITVPWIAVGQ